MNKGGMEKEWKVEMECDEKIERRGDGKGGGRGRKMRKEVEDMRKGREEREDR